MESRISQPPLVLATFDSDTGSVVHVLPIAASLLPVVMQVDPVTDYLYLVSWQPSVLTSLFIYIVDPTQSLWHTALVAGPVSVVASYDILPAGSSWLLRDELTCSVYVPSSSRLLLVMGSSAGITSAPIWHLLSISPLTGLWYEIVLADPTILASGSLSMMLLSPTNTVLLSSESGAWILHVTSTTGIETASTAPILAVSQHLSRAQQSLGCGEVAVAASVAPTMIPSSNSSSLPYAVLLLYAIPTRLSVIQAPFWYLLFVDATLDQVTYSSIDTPPLLLDQLSPLSSVTTVTSSSGEPVAYNLLHGASLLWQGSFDKSSQYVCSTNSSTVDATFIDESTLACSLPPGLIQSVVTSGTTTWLPVQLLVNEVFLLYTSQLIVVSATTVNATVFTSTLPPSSFGRLMVSYAVASSLTPSPVTSSGSGLSYAATTTASGLVVQGSPLQLHAQFSAGLTFVTQQLVTASALYPTLQPQQVISSVQSTLSQTTPVTSTGINDAFSLLASASTSGASDFQTMLTSTTSLLSQDASSLPQTLTGLDTGSVASLSLDVVGSQAQSWLENNILAPVTSDLSSLLGLGAVLPSVSSNVLSSLSSLTLNAALQFAESNPVISGVLNDPIVSDLLNLPGIVTNVVNNPVGLVGDLLPAGAIKDTVMSLLGGSSSGLSTFAGSLSNQLENVVDNLGNSLSDVVGTFTSIGQSLMDDISTDAADVSSGQFGGVLGSVSSLISSAFGGSPQLQTAVSGGVTAVNGLGEIFSGNILGGIGDLISGFLSIFGIGGGPDETQQLSQQMTKDFSQVFQDLSAISQQINTDTNTILQDLSTVQSNILNADQQLSDQLNTGFSALANLSIAGFTQLQQQQYSLYSSEMASLASIAMGIQAVGISQSEAQQELLTLLTITESAAFQVLKAERTTLLNDLQELTTDISTAIGAVPTNATFLSRVIPQPYLELYQVDMNQVCSWATSVNTAGAASMSGDPNDPSQTIVAATAVSPFYDLVFAWIPTLVSDYLSQPLPGLLQSSINTNLPNPLAYALATNSWLEARQAALQTPLLSDANCLPSLWETGQQMQAAVRLAVAPSTLNAAFSVLNDSASQVLLALNESVMEGPDLTLVDLQAFITGLNTPQSFFSGFDEICAISTLLLTLGQAAGLGTNGFTNGFVSNGVVSDTDQSTSANYQPGQSATRLIPFAAVTSISTLAQVLVGSLSNTAGATLNGSLVAQVIVSQAQTLLQLTVTSMRNAIDAFYSPCTPLPLTISQSLPSIDVTLRRLAGYMMQTQTSFTYQSTSVNFPAPRAVHIAAPIIPKAGTLCVLLYSLPGNVDYPWSLATQVQFTYNPTLVNTSLGAAITILGGSGTRTFTNRFGATVSTPMTIAASGTNSADNLLYLGNSLPVDNHGLTWNLSSPVQLPGHGPSTLYSFLNLYNASGVVAEGESSRVDNLGQAVLSNVPGFINTTIGASNVNALAANYASCQAPITFTNGLRAPTQPTSFNGALHVSYGYSISDGSTYSVSCNLSVTTNSAFATQKDQLGNPFQTVVNITGVRTYTYLPTGASLTSAVVGLTRSGRFYPYSLLASAPGVYTSNTVPFLDTDGLGFSVDPPIPINGVAPGSGPLYSETGVGVHSITPFSPVVLVESLYTLLPNPALQVQYYSLL